jgi:hypothetical protein
MGQRQTDEGEAQQLISWSPASTLVQSSVSGSPANTAAEPSRFRLSSSQPLLGSGNSAKACRKRRATG